MIKGKVKEGFLNRGREASRPIRNKVYNMKTKNVFTLTATTVTMEIFDITPFAKGEDTSSAELLAKAEFDVTAVPELLNDGDNAAKSLASYGLSRLMQDRSSDFTDGKLNELGVGIKEAAQARIDAYMATYELVKSGEFKARREAGAGKAAAVDSFFAQALVDFLKAGGKDMDINTATIYLQQRSAEERKELRAKLQPQINAARERARKAADELDLSDLLG